ncbi:thymidylate synthase family protein [Nocardia sp. X0981]
MATSIHAGDIGDAWLQAAQALARARGRTLVNLAVSIADPLREDLGIRRVLEESLADLARGNGVKRPPTLHSVHTVANTIFPISMYNPGHPGAAAEFFDRAQRVGDLHERRRNEWGTYFGRLVSYPRADGSKVNQLEKFLDVLAEGKTWSDRYEAPLTFPGESTELVGDALTADALVIGPQDRRIRGNPCLAHLSFTVLDGAIHLTALYRRHHYIARAYGNFLGLARLLNFLARESGREVGAMMIVGTHADLEMGTTAHNRDLLARAAEAQGEVGPIEVSNRGLGASWSDLELPSPARVATS